MAKLFGYYKVVQPQAKTATMPDSQTIGDQASFTNYNFYQRLVQGSASRITRYREYDIADYDVEIARSLDTIAEEMTGNGDESPSPIKIDFTDKRLSSNEVITIEESLRYWIDHHKLTSRLFGICRNLIKYGDVFFLKNNTTKSWEHIRAQDVLAAVVDETDMTSVIGWHIKRNTKVPNSPYSPGMVGTYTGGNHEGYDIVPAGDVVWFRLGNDMSEQAPFGESVLRAVYKAQKQKELLEDSVIVYRITRAPERRVFYIDVGKMPPTRVKSYLEQIKNEYRQKKTPVSTGGGTEQVDAVYNPMSTSEDLFFATRDGGRGTKVDTLPGGQSTGVIDDLKYFQWKVYRGLRIPLSYMSDDDSAAVTDGANAFISEMRFALYIQRLQKDVNETLDREFKQFLREVGVNHHTTSFRLILPTPYNFDAYRKQRLDTELLVTAAAATDIPGLSRRFIFEKYLQLTESEIKQNELMKLQELGVKPSKNELANIRIIYGNEEDPFGTESMTASSNSMIGDFPATEFDNTGFGDDNIVLDDEE